MLRLSSLYAVMLNKIKSYLSLASMGISFENKQLLGHSSIRCVQFVSASILQSWRQIIAALVHHDLNSKLCQFIVMSIRRNVNLPWRKCI